MGEGKKGRFGILKELKIWGGAGAEGLQLTNERKKKLKALREGFVTSWIAEGEREEKPFWSKLGGS